MKKKELANESVTEYILRKSTPIPECGCWVWDGVRNGNNGYGIAIFNNNREPAHRFSFKVFKGEIPDGLSVCHTCDVPNCVNPDHLFVATHRENMADKTRKGRCSSLPGEKNPYSRLTNESVSEIKSLLRSGFHESVIASKYGVVVGTIGHIRAGRTWRHID